MLFKYLSIALLASSTVAAHGNHGHSHPGKGKHVSHPSLLSQHHQITIKLTVSQGHGHKSALPSTPEKYGGDAPSDEACKSPVTVWKEVHVVRLYFS
jgi:hypothetical protein